MHYFVGIQSGVESSFLGFPKHKGPMIIADLLPLLIQKHWLPCHSPVWRISQMIFILYQSIFCDSNEILESESLMKKRGLFELTNLEVHDRAPASSHALSLAGP